MANFLMVRSSRQTFLQEESKVEAKLLSTVMFYDSFNCNFQGCSLFGSYVSHGRVLTMKK